MVCRSLVALASLTALLTACAGDDGRDTIGDSATTTATTTASSTSGGTDSTDSDSASTTGSSGSASESATGTTTGGDTTTTGAETTGAETTGTETTGGGFPGANCDPIPDCDAVPPPKLDNDPTPTDNNHRGRDMFYVDGEDQWVLAKFADGGVLDLDYHGYNVRIFLNRGCAGEWEELGTAVTSDDGDNPTVEGVEDTGGRIYFKIPADKKLAPGRHRVHMIVEDDKSTADQYIDVVPMGAPIFVSDVDGTLTTSENEEFFDLLLGDIPDANAFAASAFTILESKGYWPMYMTARPEFLYKRTREFVNLHGFPHGIIHTTLSKSGALGGEAAAYKTGELDMLAAKGLKPVYAFGNRESDAEAYNNGDIQPLENRVFFQFNDAVYGGRMINSYGELLDEFDALPDLCEQ
ncbi:MAG: phosphatidylinositol transfer protein [Myxococcales bacterium]|nr:phosphatidylinositol transfer protein [Myxococcales bacterium]